MFGFALQRSQYYCLAGNLRDRPEYLILDKNDRTPTKSDANQRICTVYVVLDTLREHHRSYSSFKWRTIALYMCGALSCQHPTERGTSISF